MSSPLFIVTGATGKLGESFVYAIKKSDQRIIGLTRGKGIEGIETHSVDLLKEIETEKVCTEIDFKESKEIVLIHAVGKFKFQKVSSDITDIDNDGIDDEIYATNVLTLKNILKPLLDKRTSESRIKVCTFASVSDKHDIPFWSSYTRAKNIMRGYLKELCKLGQIDALVVNVSTVDTGNENALRPLADKTYWLHPEEIAFKSLEELTTLGGYKEIDIIKEKPNFDPSYYLDHDAILKKWEKEMGRRDS